MPLNDRFFVEPVMIFGLIAAGFIVLFIVIGIFSAKAAEKRRMELASLARRLKLDYYPSGLSEPQKGFWQSLFTSVHDTNMGKFLARFEPFSPFGQGNGWELENLLCGRKGNVDWYAFDYSYDTEEGTGDDRRTVSHPTGVVAARLRMSLPKLTLAPENFFHKIGAVLGFDEVTFESEEFNRMYFIRCDDRKRAYDLIHPQMIEYLMQLPRRSWQMGGDLIVFTQSGYYEPSEIAGLMEELDGFLKRIPTYVQADNALPSLYASALD